MINEHFVVLGAILIVLGSVTYVRAILAGKTQPNRISWLLWATIPFIAFSAQLKQGAGWSALLTFAVGFGPLLIFFASFANRASLWKLTTFDICCGVLSAAAVCLWQITRSGTVAIVLSIAADGLAAVPTIIKSYAQPETESWHVYALYGISAGITLLTIDTWDFAHYSFAAYIAVLCTLLVALIIGKPGIRIAGRLVRAS